MNVSTCRMDQKPVKQACEQAQYRHSKNLAHAEARHLQPGPFVEWQRHALARRVSEPVTERYPSCLILEAARNENSFLDRLRSSQPAFSDLIWDFRSCRKVLAVLLGWSTDHFNFLGKCESRGQRRRRSRCPRQRLLCMLHSSPLGRRNISKLVHLK